MGVRASPTQDILSLCAFGLGAKRSLAIVCVLVRVILQFGAAAKKNGHVTDPGQVLRPSRHLAPAVCIVCRCCCCCCCCCCFVLFPLCLFCFGGSPLTSTALSGCLFMCLFMLCYFVFFARACLSRSCYYVRMSGSMPSPSPTSNTCLSTSTMTSKDCEAIARNIEITGFGSSPRAVVLLEKLVT